MKISVGVCTHNGEQYIAEQLQSIINQSVKPDEIIVSDDFSSDNTVDVAKQILEKSNINFRIIPYDTHQGILKNFSSCLDSCTGDIIFSCDQDDIWMKDKIESFIPFFKKGCNWVYSNAMVINSDKKILFNNFWNCYGIEFDKISTKEFSNIILNNLCIAGCNMAFTKELYNRVRPIPYHYLHDGWLAISAPWFGKIAFINKPLIMYRRHGGNVSGFVSKDKTQSNDVVKQKKRIIGDKYRTTEPNSWFNDPAHYYQTSKIFSKKMSEYIDKEYLSRVNKCTKFYDALTKCLPSHRFTSVLRLMGQFLSGNYKLFRGNFKRLVRDIIYLMFNQNKDFVYDFNKW